VLASCTQETTAVDLALIAAVSANGPVTDATRATQLLASIHEASADRPGRAASVSLRAHGMGVPLEWPGVVGPDDVVAVSNRGKHAPNPNERDGQRGNSTGRGSAECAVHYLAVLYQLQGYRHLVVVPAGGNGNGNGDGDGDGDGGGGGTDQQVDGGDRGSSPGSVLSLPRRAHLLPPSGLRTYDSGSELQGHGHGRRVVLDTATRLLAKRLMESLPAGVHPIAAHNDAETAMLLAQASAEAAASAAMAAAAATWSEERSSRIRHRRRGRGSVSNRRRR